MAFECGFNYVKKYKSATVNDVLSVNNYLTWRDDPILRDYYKTFYDYCIDNEYDYDSIPEADIIEHYASLKDNKTGDVYKTLEYWCSIGRLIDAYVPDNLIKNSDGIYIGIDKDFIDRAITWVESKLHDNRLVSVQVLNAYKYKEDKCRSLVPCDGLEVADEFGNRKFVDANTDLIFVTSSNFNTEENYAYTKFREALDKMNNLLDEGNLIWYYYK